MSTRGNQKKIHLVENSETKAVSHSPTKLVFIGGQNHSTGEPCSLVDTYDTTGEISTDSIRIPLPEKRLDATLVAKDGDFYIIGGFDGIKTCDTVYKFTQTEMRWKEMNKMKFARNGHTSCLVGDYIIVAGGVGNDMKRIASVEAYDITKDDWINLPDLPHGAIANSASCEYNGEFVFSGGIGGPSIPSTIVVSLNIASKRWRRLPDLRCRRSQHSMASVNGELYALGGASNKTIERLELNTHKFVSIGELPVAKCGSSAVVIGEYIILAGGWSQDDPIVRYNVQSCEATTAQIERKCFSPHVALFKPEVVSLWVMSRAFVRSHLDNIPTEGSTIDDKIQQLPLPKIIKEEI